MSHYDNNNIFARILRGEIPCKKVYENDDVLAFYDITPKAPIHILIIPKGLYKDFYDFTAHASAQKMTNFWKSINIIAEQEKIVNSGFRLISNNGKNSGQEVPHFHVHLLAGKFLGPLITE